MILNIWIPINKISITIFLFILISTYNINQFLNLLEIYYVHLHLCLLNITSISHNMFIVSNSQ